MGQAVANLWCMPSDFQISSAFAAIPAIDHFKLNRLVFGQGGQPSGLNSGDVDENILTAIVRLNEPITLFGIEPLYSAFRHAFSPFQVMTGAARADFDDV